MRELPEHEERRVREYVDGQFREPDNKVTLVQKVGERRVTGRDRSLYDVHTAKGERWWVITDPLNFYSQGTFPELEMAFTYHLGLSAVLSERSRRRADTEADTEDVRYAPQAWRRFRQAADAMDTADEAEQFQAIGVMCREALLALVREHVDAKWIPTDVDRPQLANFKAWGDILAAALTAGRYRAYLKALVDKTWDLGVWLQHYAEATPWDAEIVLDATAHLLGSFCLAMIRHDEGAPGRCPECASYRIDEDGELGEGAGQQGWRSWDVCAACGWRSDTEFKSFTDEFERVAAYAATHGHDDAVESSDESPSSM